MMASTPATFFAYDASGRMYYQSSNGQVFHYDGGQLIMETNNSAIVDRYVPGPSVDEPIVRYEGSGTSTRRWLHADERGSIVANSDGSGNLVGSTPNRYDEYGVPQGTLTGRFGYTGQAWLPESGLYHYRARMYNPTLGGFMQPDPIGYGAGMNLYAYVRNDPVNLADPTGTTNSEMVTGTRIPNRQDLGPGLCGSCTGSSTISPTGNYAGIDFLGATASAHESGHQSAASSLGMRDSGSDWLSWDPNGGSLSPTNLVWDGGSGADILVVASQGVTWLTPTAGPVPWDPRLLSQYYELGPSELRLTGQTYRAARDQIDSGFPLSNRRIGLHRYLNNGPIAFLPPPIGEYVTVTVYIGDDRGRNRIVVDTRNTRWFWYTPNHYEYFIPIFTGR